jgi:hypothetical protein
MPRCVRRFCRASASLAKVGSSPTLGCKLKLYLDPIPASQRDSMPLEILHSFFVFLGRTFSFERAEISAFSCLRIFLARI